MLSRAHILVVLALVLNLPACKDEPTGGRVSATICSDFLADEDGDGHGDSGRSQCLLAPTSPYVATEGGDCDDNSSRIHPGASETCDGTDEDCDGNVDEGTVTRVSCSVGIGECERDGVLSCEFESGDPACLADPGEPSEEACNGRDDDCDGLVDEEDTCPPGEPYIRSPSEIEAEEEKEREDVVVPSGPVSPSVYVVREDGDCSGELVQIFPQERVVLDIPTQACGIVSMLIPSNGDIVAGWRGRGFLSQLNGGEWFEYDPRSRDLNSVVPSTACDPIRQWTGLTPRSVVYLCGRTLFAHPEREIREEVSSIEAIFPNGYVLVRGAPEGAYGRPQTGRTERGLVGIGGGWTPVELPNTDGTAAQWLFGAHVSNGVIALHRRNGRATVYRISTNGGVVEIGQFPRSALRGLRPAAILSDYSIVAYNRSTRRIVRVSINGEETILATERLGRFGNIFTGPNVVVPNLPQRRR